MTVSYWSVNVSRDDGGERWKWPKVQWWLTKRATEPSKNGRTMRSRAGYPNLRIGWRSVAWGIHLDRIDLSDEDVDDIATRGRSA